MIKSVLLKKCHSKLKADLYINELNSRGIYTYISNEHTADMIPFGEGGYELRVEIDKLDAALKVIEEMDENYVAEEEFYEATQEDIAYEKLKSERQKIKNKRDKLTYILLSLFILLLLIAYISKNSIL